MRPADSKSRLRGLIAVLLSVLVAGCGWIREPAPSGVPIELRTATRAGSCDDVWVEGALRWVSGIDIELEAPDAVEWPVGADPKDEVPVIWPDGYTAVRLADSAHIVAIIDPSGGVVAWTGRTYRFRGGWIFASTDDGPPRFSGWFGACAELGSVVPA